MKELYKPKHGEEGTYREFTGHWTPELTYTGDRSGSDVYCAYCDTWNTVEGTNILFSVIGNCKYCGASFCEESKTS